MRGGYGKLAQLIEVSITEPWSSARLDALFYSGSSFLFGEYTIASTGRIRDFDTSWDMNNAFRDLRGMFKDLGQPVWGRACFQLERGGEFNVQWYYEHCDENGDLVWDEARFDEFRQDGIVRMMRAGGGS